MTAFVWPVRFSAVPRLFPNNQPQVARSPEGFYNKSIRPNENLSDVFVQKPTFAANNPPPSTHEVAPSGAVQLRHKAARLDDVVPLVVLSYVQSQPYLNQANTSFNMDYGELADALITHLRLKPLPRVYDDEREGLIRALLPNRMGPALKTLAKQGWLSVTREASPSASAERRWLRPVGDRDIADLEQMIILNQPRFKVLTHQIEDAIAAQTHGYRPGDALIHDYQDPSGQHYSETEVKKAHRLLAQRGKVRLEILNSEKTSTGRVRHYVIQHGPQPFNYETLSPKFTTSGLRILLKALYAAKEGEAPLAVGDLLPPVKPLANQFACDSNVIARSKAIVIGKGWAQLTGQNGSAMVTTIPETADLKRVIEQDMGGNYALAGQFIEGIASRLPSGFSYASQPAWLGLDSLADAFGLPSTQPLLSKRAKAKAIKDYLIKTPCPVLVNGSLEGRQHIFFWNPVLDPIQTGQQLTAMTQNRELVLSAGFYDQPLWQLPLLYESQVKLKPVIRISPMASVVGGGPVYQMQFGLRTLEAGPCLKPPTDQPWFFPLSHLPKKPPANVAQVDTRLYAQRVLEMVGQMCPDPAFKTLLSQPAIPLHEKTLEVLEQLQRPLSQFGVEVQLAV